MVIAVLFTLLVINPLYLLWRGPTRWIERRVWRWQLDRAATPAAPGSIALVVRVAALEADDRDPDARSALLGARRARSAACRAACRLPPSSPRPFRSGA